MKKTKRLNNLKPLIDGISQQTIAAGNADWYRDAATPFAQSIEEVIPYHVGKIPPPLQQLMTRGVMNSYTEIVVLGVSFFFAKKIGEDFYDVMMKPRIRKFFERMDKKLSGANLKTQKLFVYSVWRKKPKVVVSVSIVDKKLSGIATQLDLLGTIHSDALNWIKEHGVKAPVHHYRIENGTVNAKPLLLETIDDTTKLELAKKLPSAIPPK